MSLGRSAQDRHCRGRPFASRQGIDCIRPASGSSRCLRPVCMDASLVLHPCRDEIRPFRRILTSISRIDLASLPKCLSDPCTAYSVPLCCRTCLLVSHRAQLLARFGLSPSQLLVWLFVALLVLLGSVLICYIVCRAVILLVTKAAWTDVRRASRVSLLV